MGLTSGQNVRAQGLLGAWLVGLVTLLLVCKDTISTTTSTTVMIQDIYKLSSQCVDYSGSLRDHGHEWPSSAGACDNNRCVHVFSGYYLIRQTCRDVADSENPDGSHCTAVTNGSASFPSCCPQLECSPRDPLTTLDPLLCVDLATNFSCTTWQYLTNCSDGAYPVLYNYTQNYCRKTCGLC